MTQAAARADATTIAAAPSASPQSQLAVMAGNVATINPQGDTARFLLADIKGKDAAVAYRQSVIRTAVLELLKGNPRNLKEAAALLPQLGAGGKAKAYAAGFAVVADVQAIERTGKWMDSANADVRTQADTLADAYALQFISAYAAVLDGSAAKAAATRAANKAAKAAAAASATPSETSDDNTPADAVSANMELSIGDVVDSVVSAIQQGMLSAEELVLIRAALAASDAIDTDISHLLSSTPVLLQAQAH